MIEPTRAEKLKGLRLLKKLAIKLRDVPRRKFDMDQWHCGTKACALGWAPTLIPESQLRIENGMVVVTRRESLGVWQSYGTNAAEYVFRISNYEAMNLFLIDTNEVLTPKAQSKRMLNFVKEKRKSLGLK